MAASRLRLLDGFAFEHDGSTVSLPVSMQRLLALLALHGTTHRSVISGTLWPDVPEAHSLGSLRTGVWRLNRLVPGLLRPEGHAMAMSPALRVDTREQEAFALRLLRDTGQDEDWLDRGLAILWPGRLLPGWYDDWVVFERERLQQLRLHALDRTADLLRARGRLDLALQLALEAVRTEPLRETSNAALIAVYLAEGNASDAVHHYQIFRDLLDRELGLEPSPLITSLLPQPRRHRDAAVTTRGS